MKNLLIALFMFIALPQINFAQQSDSSSTNDPTVYITTSGTKYHQAGCSSLSKSSFPKKLSEVKDSYSPCGKCYKSSDNTSKSESKSTDSNVGTGTTKSGQTIYTGPRGGKYHYSKSGKKVYEKK